MTLYGLIGFPLGHSFSKRYFSEKFEREGVRDVRYELFPLEDIAALPDLLDAHPELAGLNVTLPHKVSVLPYLDELDDSARQAGAVNTIRIRNGVRTGFNTDVYGFHQSLLRSVGTVWAAGRTPLRALVLGNGGAARAVTSVLRQLGVPFLIVSRSLGGADRISWEALRALDFREISWIINTTPLGMYPDTASCPDLPFERLDARHFVFDLVYNPPQTLLLQRAQARGCATLNGLEMLHLQAEQAWEIWRTPA